MPTGQSERPPTTARADLFYASARRRGRGSRSAVWPRSPTREPPPRPPHPHVVWECLLDNRAEVALDDGRVCLVWDAQQDLSRAYPATWSHYFLVERQDYDGRHKGHRCLLACPARAGEWVVIVHPRNRARTTRARINPGHIPRPCSPTCRPRGVRGRMAARRVPAALPSSRIFTLNRGSPGRLRTAGQ